MVRQFLNYILPMIASFLHLAKPSQMCLVQSVLNDFCIASGHKFNIHKSKFLASKNISQAKKDKFQGIIGFGHTMNLGHYLGVSRFYVE